jgi:hypothetical protein
LIRSDFDGELQLVEGTLIAAKCILRTAAAVESKKRKAPVALCPLPEEITKHSKFADIPLQIQQAADKIHYSQSGGTTSSTLAALVGTLGMTFVACRKQPEKGTLDAGSMFWSKNIFRNAATGESVKDKLKELKLVLKLQKQHMLSQ